MKRGFWAVVLLFSLTLVACSKSEEIQSAKQTFQVHEKRSKDNEFLLSQQELKSLNSETAAMKIMLMPHRVIARLIGPHTFKSKLYHKVAVLDSNGNEQQGISMWEEQTIEWRKDGSFHLKFTPERGSGLELLWLNKTLFMRLGQGLWKKEVSDWKHHFYLEKATTAKERFYRLLRGYINFKVAGETTYEGRRAIKLALSLDKNRHNAPKELPITTATGGKYRLNIKAMNNSLEEERERIEKVEQINGEILVDAQTGAPLSGSVEATYLEKIRKGSATGRFTLKYEFAFTNIGKEPELKEPEADTVVDKTERRRWVPKSVFKDMPKDLKEKSGVLAPRKVLPPELEQTKSKKSEQKTEKQQNVKQPKKTNEVKSNE